MSFDQRLMELAETFAQAFHAALIKSEHDFVAILTQSTSGFSTGPHGTVEFTQELVDASRELSKRAVKVFGSSRIHQKSVEEIARTIAFNRGEDGSVKDIARAIVDGITESARKEYRVIRPNQLMRFMTSIDDVKVGPVRILRREEIRRDVEGSSSIYKIAPLENGSKSFDRVRDEYSPKISVHFSDVCWDVSLRGMEKGLELQALWLIDVAISFVRLHYKEPIGLFPLVADVEPHPIYPHQFQFCGLTIGPNGKIFRQSSTPGSYDLDAEIINVLKSSEVVAAAELVFDPQSNTLAERMQQALGWLTRARRAQEPAERVLLFFTALEALFSPKSPNGPVIDTISRYSGVIWSERPETRFALYTALKKLYDIRSRIVHNGERSVAQIEANNVQYIIETITEILLRRADLSISHDDFVNTLKSASFGTKLEFDLHSVTPS